MNLSIRNKKVAISRWNKKHSEERKLIRNDEEALLLKASICGFLAGDGSVQRRKVKNYFVHQIDFYPDDLLMRNTYLEQINKVYKRIPSVKEKKNHEEVRLSSKVVTEDLLKISKFGTKEWRIPDGVLILKGGKENWLRAFFSAEAYVNSKSIKIQTVNKKGMLDILNALKELGINSRYYEYVPKKENHSKVFIIFIIKKEDRMKYFNQIGFWHKKKTKILSKSLYL